MAATGEIGLAVMAITLSLVAVFLPIAMMEGIVGRFLKSFGITMAATILVSMLVSFTLTPMLAARWFKPVSAEPAGKSQRATEMTQGRRLEGPSCSITCIEAVYLVALRFSLRHRWLVAGGRDRLHGHAARSVSSGPQELHPRRRLVGVPGERPGAGGHVARGHAGV